MLMVQTTAKVFMSLKFVVGWQYPVIYPVEQSRVRLDREHSCVMGAAPEFSPSCSKSMRLKGG